MERYLIDTNVLIWMLLDDSKITDAARMIIESDVDIYVSDVSLWEIAIKVNIGKLELAGTIPGIEKECACPGFDKLEIRSSHFECLRTLPLIHKDPFDRLIISQAKVEGLTLITADQIIPNYDIKVAW